MQARTQALFTSTTDYTLFCTTCWQVACLFHRASGGFTRGGCPNAGSVVLATFHCCEVERYSAAVLLVELFWHCIIWVEVCVTKNSLHAYDQNNRFAHTAATNL